MKKFILILFLFFLSFSLKAENVNIDGINYEITYIYNIGQIARCKGPAQKSSFKKENLTIPEKVNGNTVYYIDENAFKNCADITGTLTLPSGLNKIDLSAFENCTGITEIKFTPGTEQLTIDHYAFRNCSSLTGELIFPDNIFSIWGQAFENCTNISSCILGRGLYNLGYTKNSSYEYGGVFAGCTNLKKITSYAFTPPYSGPGRNGLSSSVGWNFPDFNIPLYVDKDAINAYKEAPEWKLFTNILAIPAQASNITLSVNNLVLKVGEFDIITASLYPADADISTISWSSQNPEIANVENGLVTGLKVGQTIVTATSGSVSAQCIVKVISESQSGGSTGGNGNWFEDGDENASLYKRIFMVPDEDANFASQLGGLSAASWSSGNEDIVEVTKRGIAYAYEFGETVVRAKDADGKTIAIFEVFVCPTVTVEHGDGILYTHHVLYNSHPTLVLNPGAGYKIAGVTHDEVDIKDELIGNDGVYVPENPITANSVINLTTEEDGNGPTTGAGNVLSDNKVRIYVHGHVVNIKGVYYNTNVRMYNLAGTMLFNHKNYDDIKIIDPGVYVIEIDGQPNRYKIVIR